MIKKIFITLLVFICFTSKTFSNEFIGVIGIAVGEIYNQKNEKLINESKIFYGDTIIVKSKSNTQILFLDETVMTLGEDTEVTIDDFIYDPTTNDGNFVTNIKSGIVKTISGKISEKNPDNLEIKMPNGTLGVRGTEFLVSANSENESTVLLLGPGPNNTLGMMPGSVQVTDGLNTTDITNPGFQAMIKTVVSSAELSNPIILNEMSSSMSHSAINSSNIINNSKNLISNLINSSDIKNDIILTAEKFDLNVDEGASEILSGLSTGSGSKEILVAMNELSDNILIEGEEDNYVRTLDQNTILYDSGWFDLTKVTTGSNGLSYSSDENVFEDGGTQQGRGKVYVNFDKKEISADVFTRVTLKGASTVSHEYTTPTVTITTIPVVASVVMALGSDGGTYLDRLQDDGSGACPNDSCPSLVNSADTLQNNVSSTQDIMDKYNHDTSNSDAAKEVFQYGKFTTVGADGVGIGTIIFEGAHDATAAPAGEDDYVQSIERLEGSKSLVGTALD